MGQHEPQRQGLHSSPRSLGSRGRAKPRWFLAVEIPELSTPEIKRRISELRTIIFHLLCSPTHPTAQRASHRSLPQWTVSLRFERPTHSVAMSTLLSKINSILLLRRRKRKKKKSHRHPHRNPRLFKATCHPPRFAIALLASTSVRVAQPR